MISRVFFDARKMHDKDTTVPAFFAFFHQQWICVCVYVDLLALLLVTCVATFELCGFVALAPRACQKLKK